MIRVGVTGGRKYQDAGVVAEMLSFASSMKEHVTIVVGCANGLDRLVRDWCKKNDVMFEEFVADWTNLGKAAGPMRNKAMLDSGMEILIAFPGGTGTAHMTGICRKAGVQVIEVSEHDSVKRETR